MLSTDNDTTLADTIALALFEECEDAEPTRDDDDLVTTDHRRFYQSGKYVLTLGPDLSEHEMWTAIDDYCDGINWHPNVWFVSDHGNEHLMERPEGYAWDRKMKLAKRAAQARRAQR